ncbi:Transient receptor putative cation channel sub M member 7 [Desmophyllum pertusum]|uniref:Transient receptor putative cation channel sub M member 7 n=1 Tax=Desmophyllum pertusum TaxID=174260 RepID=A0A9X0CN48_9CNID|nr:Transient receptor putative cation channel sub M member 7 [Desmophyllum pertusum]
MNEDNMATELRPLSRSESRELHRIPTCQRWTLETRVVKLRWGRKILEFYKAPVTKFWSNVFAYLAFLVLFSYVILVRQENIPSICEIVLIIFVCTLCTEEIRQILHSEPPTLGSKFKDWASINLGPYVVMIGRMTVDMLYFLLIMVVFLLAYGVAQQAILYPDEAASWSMVSGILFRPYFQVYGELFVDAPDTLSKTTTAFDTPRRDNHGDTIVLFIMAFYLLVANILLLNLLIAIFNNTFSSVQANANQIWKYQRYYLVMEYAQRPVLVPPFIFLNHVIHAMKGLYHWLKNCRGKGDSNEGYSSFGLKLFLEMDDLQKLMMFEERCVDCYLREKDTLRHATQEEKIRVMGDRMESVSCQFQDMYKESISQSNTRKKAADSLNTRLSKLEKHMHRMVEILHELMPEPRTLTDDVGHASSGRTVSLSEVQLANLDGHKPLSQRLSYDGPQTKELEGFRFTRRRLSTAATRAKKSQSLKHAARGKSMHVRTRLSPYPMSNQQRYPVPDFLVDWRESFSGYAPPLYTAQEVSSFAILGRP